VRWRLSPILSDADFSAATPVSGEPTPAAPGTPETFTFCGLPRDTTIYVALRTEDAAFNKSALSLFTLSRCGINQAPDCAAAYASVARLWPPEHQFVLVSILGVTDPDGDPIAFTFPSVTQDEPVNTAGSGRTCPDAKVENGQLFLRAERAGPRNGRVYEVRFVASDGRGDSCTGAVKVCVPHDMRPGGVCPDDGQIYDSFTACPPARLDPHGQPLPDEGELPVDLRLDLVRVTEGSATLQYALPGNTEVLLAVYDISGRLVSTLEKGFRAAGVHTVTWDTSKCAGGIYYCRMLVGSESLTRAIMVLR
jgi:hypothetical protein